MADRIIDSKYRVLEALPRVAGRQRYLISDLISGRMAILESVGLEAPERMQKRWAQLWQPSLREGVARFARRPSFMPVSSVGTWEGGLYYVFESDDEDSLQGQALGQAPTTSQLRVLLEDLRDVNQWGDHVLNLRPESLCLQDERLRILPSAYVLPLELLVAAGVRSPYQPPELRTLGQWGPNTDGFIVAGVLQASLERMGGPRPSWWGPVQRMLHLEPWRRPGLDTVLQQLEGDGGEAASASPRRGVNRLVELDPGDRPAARAAAQLFESLDQALAQVSEGSRVLLFVEAPATGPGLRETFHVLRQGLALLNERPPSLQIDALSSLEWRDLGGSESAVLFVPDYAPAETEMLPLDKLLAHEKLRTSLWVVGARRSTAAPQETESTPGLAEWLRKCCGTEVLFVHRVLEMEPVEMPPSPVSPAARHLLDLLSILDTDATDEILRMALPQHESELPEAVAELERLGHVRRGMEGGGWWGNEPQTVVRVMRPDALELRRASLTVHRREELHLLLSHLLADMGVTTLAQRFMRFHHLFAGGSWEGAAAEYVPLLQGIQKRGLEVLLRRLQRKLVNSNLAHHLEVSHLLEVLSSLGQWEVEQGRIAEGRRYYERASEKLFALSAEDAGKVDLHVTSDMLLAQVELIERQGGFERSLELLERYLERFGEGIPAVDRGRLFTEMGYSEFRLGRFAAAEEHCHLALKLLDARRHLQEVAQVHNILGLVRWRTSRYEEAEQYLSSSLALREKTGDHLSVARAHNNLGLLARTRRRFNEALEYHRKSTEIRQALGDATGVARGTLNLAWVHFEMQDHGQAEALARRACELSRRLGSRSTWAAAQGLLGEIFLARGRMQEARETLAEAVTLAREVSDVAELFMDLRKQASLELRCGNLSRAEELLQESEQYMSQAGSPLEEANWHSAHGELRAALGDPRGAAVSYEHAGNNLARLGDAQRAAEVFLTATRLYREAGIAGRARELLLRARQLFEREGTVLPKELVDLEVDVGEGERSPAPGPDRAVESLVQACAAAVTASGDLETLEQILEQIRACAAARYAILVRPDGMPHGASVLSRELLDAGATPMQLVQSRPRLVGRGLQTLLPLSSDDLQDEELPAPFYVLPIEARERRLGCVLLEWNEGTSLPDAGVLRMLRSMVQLLGLVLERRLVLSEEPDHGEESSETPRDETSLDHIIGKSGKRQAMVDFIRQVRDLEATVLLLGENGTGKEVVARAIHFTGGRRSAPFVTVNCTALPPGLWERELFGHERGSFTDAFETKRGYFETAHRGTLLLDEIGDMPLEMQTRFLRVLEEKSFTRIGGTQSIDVDVRIIAATNQDLESAVRAGRFRRDLYYRLNVLSTILPPLRDRRDDIPELAQHFLDRQGRSLGLRPKRLSGEALRILMQYPWPGNVRELENAMKRSHVLSEREVLAPEDLPPEVLKGVNGNEIAGALDLEEVARWVLDHASYSASKPLLDRLEKEICRQLVERIGVIAQASRLLGLSRPTLYSKLRS